MIEFGKLLKKHFARQEYDLDRRFVEHYANGNIPLYWRLAYQIYEIGPFAGMFIVAICAYSSSIVISRESFAFYVAFFLPLHFYVVSRTSHFVVAAIVQASQTERNFVSTRSHMIDLAKCVTFTVLLNLGLFYLTPEILLYGVAGGLTLLTLHVLRSAHLTDKNDEHER